MGFRRLFAGLLLAGLLSGSQPLWSQAGREKVLAGNRNYSEGDYDKALELYREALEENPDSPVIRFNLGDGHFKKEELEDAADSFSQALQSEDPEIRSRAQYNLGNSLYRQGKLQESLSAYREALKVAPGDRDAKHNLEFVLKQLQEQQQQQQQQKKNQNQQDEGEQEKDQDKNREESRSGGEDQSQQDRQDQPDRPEDQEGQDQQNEEQQSQARNDRQDSGESEQRPGDRQEDGDEESRASGGQQEEPSREDQAQASPDGAQPMSREEAERLLEALAQAQAGVKKKLELRPGRVKVEKDW